jgi:hypothetical protein
MPYLLTTERLAFREITRDDHILFGLTRTEHERSAVAPGRSRT